MSNADIPLKRITLYKNDLGYFERIAVNDRMSATLAVAKKNKKLVIDTLCTTAASVTFDSEEHEKFVTANNIERLFSFSDLSSASSFSTFLKSCIGAEIILVLKEQNADISGKLVLLEENTILLSPESKETTENYVLRVLVDNGFIRHFNRKFNRFF